MKNVASSINGVAGAVVGVVKGLIVAFVFATILFGPIDALNDGVNHSNHSKIKELNDDTDK